MKGSQHGPQPVTVDRDISARPPTAILRAAGTVGVLSQPSISRWRDSLRRRMLALADVAAVLIAVASLGFVTGADVEKTLWAAVFLPIWIVLAKLYGLYDRDHTALRHLTVDELPAIGVWTLTGTGAMS